MTYLNGNTYEKIFDLKFNKKVPTLQLEHFFPNDRDKVQQIALMELPMKTLKRLVRNEKKLEELLQLKESLFGKCCVHS